MLKKFLPIFMFAIAMTMAACDPGSSDKDEICNNGIDDDNDGFTDCADVQCLGQSGGPNGELCESQETRCNDGFDNDGNGQTDCDDVACAGTAECGGTEDCTNGVDDDGDGDIDCDDADCAGDASCLTTENCTNGTDDDGDGDVDCADSDCADDPNCQAAENCSDGQDNDSDGDIDCADSDCIGQTGADGQTCEATEVSCGDGFDNDGDGDVDCSDADCANDPSCQGPSEDCTNGTDDDGDGDIDCADAECNGQTGPDGQTCETTEVSCGDGFDNDGDGLADCADDDCRLSCMAPGSLVITEVMKNPNAVSDSNGEWFEITNTTTEDIDLRGLVVFSVNSSGNDELNVISGSDPIIIPAGGYAVLSNNIDSATNGDVTAIYEYSGIYLSNSSDDIIGIRTPDGTVLDQVSFNNTDYPAFAGMSMYLDRNHINATDNDDPANWCYPNVKYNAWDFGTPGVANPTCARESNCYDGIDNDGNGKTDCEDVSCTLDAGSSNGCIGIGNNAPTEGSLIITEIMTNPGVGNPAYQYEWFEVFNPTSATLKLNGLMICDSNVDTYCTIFNPDTDVILGAGEYAVFASDAATLTSLGISVAGEYGPSIQLSDTSDGVTLYRLRQDGTRTMIDQVLYNSDWPLSEGVAMQFSSTATYDSSAVNDATDNWCLASDTYDATNSLVGTPGNTNNICVADATELNCTNGTDDDGDGDIDCADSDCTGQAGPGGGTCEAVEVTCDDNYDNDGDGLIDSNDPDCTVGDTVDLTGWRVELWQNGSLKATYDLGVQVKGSYIVLARNVADLATWTTSFTPPLDASEIAHVSAYWETDPEWAVNGTDDGVKIFDDSNTEVDSTDAPSNAIKRRQADGSWVTDTTTSGASGAPETVTGVTSPIYIYELGEKGTTTRLTNYNGNYVMLYIPN